MPKWPGSERSTVTQKDLDVYDVIFRIYIANSFGICRIHLKPTSFASNINASVFDVKNNFD